MKRSLRLGFIALALATPFSRYEARPAPDVDEESAVLSPCVSVAYVDYYVGSNARWIVDRQNGSVSAWELNRPLPLWSNDGVVFRLSSRRNVAPSRLSATSADSFAPTTEFFGRAYFFLNDASHVPSEGAASPFVRRDDLLLALDLRAQGRLVWKLRARDFARFFASDVSSLQFLPQLEPLPNDELLAVVQGDRNIKRFAISAADGTPRLLDAPAQSK